MKIIVLGSGTCVPSIERSSPGYLVETDERLFLVDCGSGSLRQVVKAGRDFREIDAVLITHPHPDHISDLIPLLHALMAAPGYRREKDLLIAGTERVRQFCENCVFRLLRRPDTFSVTFISAEEKFYIPPVHVFTHPVYHSPGSIAYRIERGGKSVVFTGDTDYGAGLIGFSEGADLIVADSSYLQRDKIKGHMTPGECGRLAKKAGVRSLLLSHIYPVGDEEEFLQEAMEEFDSEVVMARDLMQLEI
jgi:ribonuclease BN (tRNA processing enzyme)